MSIVKVLIVTLCVFQSVKVSGQNTLNQYDDEGRKNGQWLEIAGYFNFVTNYNHGKRDGICYQLKHKGEICSIYEYDNGRLLKIISFDDQQRLQFMITDFVDVDTIVRGRDLTHRFRKRFKSIGYHPNGVIESIETSYLLEGGDPEIDSFEFGKAYYYDEKGNLVETKELFTPSF